MGQEYAVRSPVARAVFKNQKGQKSRETCKPCHLVENMRSVEVGPHLPYLTPRRYLVLRI
jgi:cytochrome c2